MKVYTCIDHACHWPVGVASVIVASNEIEARALLVIELRKTGLEQTDPFTLQDLDLNIAKATVLCDGNY